MFVVPAPQRLPFLRVCGGSSVKSSDFELVYSFSPRMRR
ncbi:Hypothetical protein Cul05146_1837 [Corynebacterium ulcerans]|nr:Hypothetical protein Cul05146_1837 [Corynebacterium ulcerans]